MKIKKILSVILIMSLVFSVFAGCSQDDSNNIKKPSDQSNTSNNSEDNKEASGDNNVSDDDNIDYDHILKKAVSASPAGKFNPALTSDAVEQHVTAAVFEALTIVKPDYTIDSNLAKSWTISEDSKTITFDLVDNAKWHDGTPFTAKDVEFTLKFIGHKDYPGQFYTRVSAIKGMQDYKDGKTDTVEGIKVINDYKIEITTENIHAPFLVDMAYTPIIAEHIWGKVDMVKSFEQTDLMLNPIGTGPFKMEKFVPDQYIKMTRNEDYWKARPKMAGILIQVVNAETSQAQFLNGDLDLINTGALNKDDQAVYDQMGATIYITYNTSFLDLGLNLKNDLLKDKNVRKALLHAINRQGICDSIYNGYATVANTVYAPFFWAYPGDDALINYEYDPEKAKSMLTEAGWEYKDGKMYANGKPVSFTVLTTSGKTTDLVMVVLQENLKNIGIELKIDVVEFATQLDTLRSGEGYDMYYLGSGVGSDADARLILSTDAIGKGNNFTGYSNSEVDKLLEEGVKYVEIEERKDIYSEVAKIVNDELPSLYIANWGSAVITNPKMKGITPVTYTPYLYPEEWYFEK